MTTANRNKHLAALLCLWPDEADNLLADTDEARALLVARLQVAFNAERRRVCDCHFAASYGRAHALLAALKIFKVAA